MKLRNIILAMIIGISSLSCAQICFDEVYHDCRWIDKEICFSVPAWIFKWAVPDTDTLAQQAIAGLRRVSVIVSERADEDLTRSLHKLNKSRYYEDLMIVKDDGSKIVVRARKHKDDIREIILSIKDDDNLVAVSMKGRFKEEDINKVVQIIMNDIDT